MPGVQVRMPLERKFRRYLHHGAESTELLMHLLDRMVRDNMEFQR